MNDLSLYEKVRDRMGTGDLLLWAADSLLGEAIRLFSKAEVNHASVVVKMDGIRTYRLFNYESLSDGFGPHYLSKELEKYEGSVWWLPLLEGHDRAAIEERVFQFDGTPYDYRTLFQMAVSAPDKDTSEMICSEAAEVVITGEAGGVVHSPGELPALGIFGPPVQILKR